MKTIRPSLLRHVTYITIWFAILCVGTYLWQGYSEGHWWGLGYIYTLAIPYFVILIFTWIFFVPKFIRIKEDGFEIGGKFYGTYSLPFENITAFGSAYNVFIINGHLENYTSIYGTSWMNYQITPFSFRKSEWKEVASHLRNTIPDKESKLWLGPFGVLRKNKSNNGVQSTTVNGGD